MFSDLPSLLKQGSYPFKIGIVGCGQITYRVYAPILVGMPEQVQVVAVCDINEAPAERLARHYFPEAKIYTDISLMLQKQELDAVMVLTSETANAAMTRRVVTEAGLPVYLEKPPALNMVELKDLIKVEKESPVQIYTAFNRRHTPLFQQIGLPHSPLLKVTGKITRTGRAVAAFPYTCVHLLDSAQYYSRSRFMETEVVFEPGEVPRWKLQGRLENGAQCDLTFIPDGESENEYLIFETKEERWEAHFPDSDGLAPKVRLIWEKDNYRREETSDATLQTVEVMGYAPCFRRFIQHLQSRDLANSIHRLESCTRTIEILEAMVKCQSNQPSLVAV